ncbi:MAG TPA: hypothetical protein VLT32_01950, partial [Candidatus Sulfomarinibacteraceae bacterium]|nr:hypothetical protein [Candidatus Sulfomarinibacteraceae bacterium]
MIRQIVLWLGVLCAVPAAAGTVFDPADLRLIDQVDLGAADPGHRFVESAPGASRIASILGRQTRVMDPHEDARYFAVRLGEGAGLVAGAAYVLQVDYPEDAPRSMIIVNRGAEIFRGFATGKALGDNITGYGHSNPESLDLPLSGRHETWETLFFLHDRTGDVSVRRGVWYDPLSSADFPLEPADGFWVIIAQNLGSQMPVAQGAAVSRIRLYELLDEHGYELPVHLPPSPLPRRHVFFREEMANRVIEHAEAGERAVADDASWFEHRMRLMRFLGIRTFAMELLEFGHNQGFDAAAYGGSSWWVEPVLKDRWERVAERLGGYAFEVLPYFEYAGSTGTSLGLGFERRAQPLDEDAPQYPNYTNIGWSENFNVDLTDPDTMIDLQRTLDTTVVDFADRVPIAGVWLRQRLSHLPISFADATRQRYAADRGVSSPTRQQLQADPNLRDDYYVWWFDRRAVFLETVRTWLADRIGSHAALLFTPEYGEPGPRLLGNNHLVNDAPSTWDPLMPLDDIESWWVSTPLADVVADGRYLDAVLAGPGANPPYEMWHSAPPADPQRYSALPLTRPTFPINRMYTVGSPTAMAAFADESGGNLAVTRMHYLNEDRLLTADDDAAGGWGENGLIGYFVADFERAGPHSMLEEALAVAHGNARFIGHLTGNSFNRGFPRYARRFYAAFLSLPALPGEVLEGAADHPDVVVRRIPTPDHGTWFAVVNAKRIPLTAINLDFGETGHLVNSATGELLAVNASSWTVDLDPWELRAFRLATGPVPLFADGF